MSRLHALLHKGPRPGAAMKIGINQSGLSGFPDYAHTNIEKFVGYATNGWNWFNGFFGTDQGEVSDTYLTDGWVSSLPAAGAYFRRYFICDPGTQYQITWDGDFAAGDFNDHFFGNATENSWDAGTRTGAFTTPAGTAPVTIYFMYHFTNLAAYPKNIQVKKVGAPAQRFEPKYLTEINRYNGTLRFTKWLPLVEANSGAGPSFTKFGGGTAGAPIYPIIWSKRRKLTDGTWAASFADGHDGTPVELIVEAGNAFTGDAVHIPITSLADDNYITNFATYVRDNLDTSKKIYIEIDNEAWNDNYDVKHRFRDEAADPAISASYPVLGADGDTPLLLRYIHVSKRIHDIWMTVFAGQTSRLKPMLCFQHVAPSRASLVLAQANTNGWLTNIKAIATAPYFGAEGLDASFTGSMATFFAACQADIDHRMVSNASTYRSLANTYGFEYVTYEAGYGHDINDLTTLNSIKTSSLMYDTYLYYFHSLSPYYNRMTLFTFSESIWVNDGIYGHVFPSVYEVNVSKANTPALQGVIDFLAGA